MDNYFIAEQLSLLSKLTDIHGENSFKAKTYAVAAFTLEKLTDDVSKLEPEKIFRIKGIGESVGRKIIEIINTGGLEQLNEYISKTPEGVLDMMNIKGLGPRKINILWKEMKINSISDLEAACIENRIANTKGFGEKTQQNILNSIQFRQQNSGKYLYASIEDFALALTDKLKEKFKNEKLELTGSFRRQAEIIESIDYVTTISGKNLKNILTAEEFELATETDGMIAFKAKELLLRFFITEKNNFYNTLFQTSSSEEFLDAWEKSVKTAGPFSSEEDIFINAGMFYIPAPLREKKEVIEKSKKQSWENLVQTKDIKGLIHSHSNWSDGSYTIEQMAQELIELGFEYLVISDHSKAAFYANGLSEQRIKEQHHYVDELNDKLSPFKIFKSIECDILNDGSLDYDNKVLSTFDLVITSVHSNLAMDEEKAMRRLLGAITNPFTTILGHMTGRLLLKRNGFPVDYETIIQACADHHVVIEINASPSRLDMDWRWIQYAMEKNVLLSIDPDAHTIEEFHNIKYGVLVAQKGGLIPSRNVSSFTLKEFENFLTENRRLKKTIQ